MNLLKSEESLLESVVALNSYWNLIAVLEIQKMHNNYQRTHYDLAIVDLSQRWR